MKKILAMTISAALLFSMTACSKEDKNDTKEKRETTKETSAEDEEEETEEKEPEEEETENEQESELKLVFSTHDRDGYEYTDAIFADYEVTMVNMWEPWCGPCVGEMPDLQKLYENYKDEGFNIIGVYSETEMEEDVDAILEECGTEYTILKCNSDFDMYQTGYVPTTFFVDKNGNLINVGSDDAYLLVGSKSYDEWESYVKEFLGK